MKKDRFLKLVLSIVVLLFIFSMLSITLRKLRFAGKLECHALAPGFCLRSSEEIEYTNSNFYGNKLVLLYLRNSCPYCTKQLSNILLLYKYYNPKEIQFVAVRDKPKRTNDDQILILIDEEKKV